MSNRHPVSDVTQNLLDRVKRFVREELLSLERLLLDQRYQELEKALDDARRQVKAAGLWAPNHPRDLGGLELSLVEHGLISEALGYCAVGHYAFGCQAPDAGNIEVLERHASPDLRERYLRPLVAGEIRSCFSMTEVEQPGSNPLLLETSAVRDGDDYVINGHKWYTTAAEGSAFAIVMAVTQPDAPPHQRASMILVPTDTEGFERLRNLPVMGEPGHGYFSHAEIVYRDVRVPIANRLGPDGGGFVIAQERLGPGRIHHCMRWLGICRRAFDLMCQRAVSRQLRPNETLADQGIVQAWVAESAADIAAARALTLETAAKIDQLGFKAARDDISMIKFLVAGVLGKVVDRALQVHGGLGMTDDTILAYYYRHERASRIYDGPDEVHKVSLARRLLRGYAAST